MSSPNEAAKSRPGPAASIPRVVESAAQLREILDQLDSITGKIGEMSLGNDIGAQYCEIVRRAAIVRQREALAAIISLSESGHSAFAVCLLRPAYEELIWIEYLAQHPELANEALIMMVRIGQDQSLSAMKKYLSAEQFGKIRFRPDFVRTRLAQAKGVRESFRKFGQKLGWNTEDQYPSVAHIAGKVGRNKEYSYIYHATSRFVHFTPHELVRRAWGNPSAITISSAHFSGYWSAFALHWGLRIYINTLAACPDLLDFEAAPADTFERLLGLLAEYVPPPPIITPEELKWP
jgi:hypothetical protein